MNIKGYLINVIVLPIIIIMILGTIVMGILWGSKEVSIVSIVSDVFGIISFILIVIVVSIILQHNPPNDTKNRLVQCKKRLISWVETHKRLKWLQGDRAVEFSCLFVGITLGLCGLGLRLGLDIISLC